MSLPHKPPHAHHLFPTDSYRDSYHPYHVHPARKARNIYDRPVLTRIDKLAHDQLSAQVIDLQSVATRWQDDIELIGGGVWGT